MSMKRNREKTQNEKHTEETEQNQKNNSEQASRSEQELEIEKPTVMKECCKEQYDMMNDQYLRLLAEFENFRRRTLKEKEELFKTASSKVITSILPVLDDFDRALSTLQKTEETKAIIDGIELIQKKLTGILRQEGLEIIQCMNCDFDTDFHEALTIVESEEGKKGKVIDEIEKGYMLNGRVIRYAKVVVGK